MKDAFEARMNKLFPDSAIKVLDLEFGSITLVLLDVKYHTNFFSRLARSDRLELSWPNAKNNIVHIKSISFRASTTPGTVSLGTIEEVRSCLRLLEATRLEQDEKRSEKKDVQTQFQARSVRLLERFIFFDPDTDEPADRQPSGKSYVPPVHDRIYFDPDSPFL